MCGIVGFNFENEGLIKKMAYTIRHRGPDNEGFFVNPEISLGHRRLAIIDLSETANQPMSENDITIIFNGEIYNFVELRNELKEYGHTFKTNSDTEVIIKAYKEWGTKCVSKFNGMWAFCIYDKQKQKLFISRDRFGIKPLYYYYSKGKFIFASELKAIRVHDIPFNINQKALNYYFYQKYIGNQLSIFENIFKLQASENLEFDLNTKQMTLSNYYNLKDEIEKHKFKSNRTKYNEIKQIIESSVLSRLTADVPVGSFLSGGIDSSLISAIIANKRKNFKTFSIGFKQKSYNELKFSEIVAKHINTQHNTDFLEINSDLLKKTIASFDEPFGDSSVLPTYLLSKITKSEVSVSLSGDAADEIFGGYDVYQAFKIAKIIPNFILVIVNFLIQFIPDSDKKVSLIFKIKRFLRTNNKNSIKRHLDWLATFPDIERKELLQKKYLSSDSFGDTLQLSGKNRLLDIQLNDIQHYMEGDILKKVDIASMLNSLEVRIPFLDYRLVPLVLSLSEKYKIKGLKTKYLLKQIAKEYLPKKIVLRKKRGFTIPVSEFIRNNELIKTVLSEEKYFSHQYIYYPYSKKLFNEHINYKKDNSRQLWLIFVFNYWYYKNISRA